MKPGESFVRLLQRVEVTPVVMSDLRTQWIDAVLVRTPGTVEMVRASPRRRGQPVLVGVADQTPAGPHAPERFPVAEGRLLREPPSWDLDRETDAAAIELGADILGREITVRRELLLDGQDAAVEIGSIEDDQRRRCSALSRASSVSSWTLPRGRTVRRIRGRSPTNIRSDPIGIR